MIQEGKQCVNEEAQSMDYGQTMEMHSRMTGQQTQYETRLDGTLMNVKLERA